MVRLDHLSLPVGDWRRSRDWYTQYLGFQIEFERADAQLVALRDDADLTVFLQQGEVASCPGIAFTIQVDDVHAKHRELAVAGIRVAQPPAKLSWGYGGELLVPDGHRLRLWDPKSMKEKG